MQLGVYPSSFVNHNADPACLGNKLESPWPMKKVKADTEKKIQAPAGSEFPSLVVRVVREVRGEKWKAEHGPAEINAGRRDRGGRIVN